MPRISQLPSLTTADNADEIAIVDVSASTTKKITRGDLLKAPLPNNSVTTAAIANSAVTPVKIDFTTFPGAIQANGTNIVLPAGKTYFVMHTVNVEQVNTANQSMFIYNITGMPSTTWTAKAGGLASWDRPANMGIINGGVTVSRTSTTSANVAVSGERFVAIPLFQSAP